MDDKTKILSINKTSIDFFISFTLCKRLYRNDLGTVIAPEIAIYKNNLLSNENAQTVKNIIRHSRIYKISIVQIWDFRVLLEINSYRLPPYLRYIPSDSPKCKNST